jgi:hypothetical protein
LLDPSRGIELAKTVTQGSNAPLGYLDTLAACKAAHGDFQEAEQIERDVVKRVQESSPASNPFIERGNERIKLFHNNQAYIEAKP